MPLPIVTFLVQPHALSTSGFLFLSLKLVLIFFDDTNLLFVAAVAIAYLLSLLYNSTLTAEPVDFQTPFFVHLSAFFSALFFLKTLQLSLTLHLP